MIFYNMIPTFLTTYNLNNLIFSALYVPKAAHNIAS